MNSLEDIFIPLVVFSSIYFIVKAFLDYNLKRKVINSGHLDKAGILDQKSLNLENYDRSPSLKWGLVALFAGMGFILIEVINKTVPAIDMYESPLPFGIILVFIALGFLLYYLVMVNKEKK